MSRTTSQFLTWPVHRIQRTVRYAVVEPTLYSPSGHDEVFASTLTFILGGSNDVESTQSIARKGSTSNFDLITFPEAFLSATALCETLAEIAAAGPTGCFHTGIRPTPNDESHLFTFQQVRSLIANLKQNLEIEADDLHYFNNWHLATSKSDRYNLGAIFAVDRNGKARVCIYPKAVRSKFERSPLEDSDMAEGDLVTTITLLPAEPAIFSLTLQPVLCSDALNLPTEIPDGAPLIALGKRSANFQVRAVENIDVVSVATCTPQPSGKQRKWHNDFRAAFVAAAQDIDYARHHQAIFVLSNFAHVSRTSKGGLSGVFLPVRLNKSKFPPFCSTQVYCRTSGEHDAAWDIYESDAEIPRSSQGYMTYLDHAPLANQLAAVFSFEQRVLREVSAWHEAPNLSKIRCHIAIRKETDIKFAPYHEY